MNFFTQLFHTILFQPFLNILILLYIYLPGKDFGIAIIVLTVAIKLALYPLTLKGLKHQKASVELQPKLNEIKEKYKDNKAEQSKAMMELYKTEKLNPMSGCLPLLIQLPIIIALYRVFQGVFEEATVKASLYSFVPNPGIINPTFLGISLLENQIFITILAVLSGVAQFYQMKMMKSLTKTQTKGKKKDFASNMQTQMSYVMPLISFFLVYKLGAVIGIYWLVTILFSVGEQYLLNKKDKTNPQKI